MLIVWRAPGEPMDQCACQVLDSTVFFHAKRLFGAGFDVNTC